MQIKCKCWQAQTFLKRPFLTKLQAQVYQQGAWSSFALHSSRLEWPGTPAGAPRKDDCNPWATKLHPPPSLLKPKSLCIYGNPPCTIFFLHPTLPVQPDAAGAPTAAAAMGGLDHTLPSGLWPIASTAPATPSPHGMPVPALAKDAALCLDRCTTRETTSEHICQPSCHEEVPEQGQQRAAARAQAAAGVTSLDACQVLLPPGKSQVKFAESFWALSRFQLILTDSFAR